MIELSEDLILRKPFEPGSDSNGTFFWTCDAGT
jgi:hypothetical protein